MTRAQLLQLAGTVLRDDAEFWLKTPAGTERRWRRQGDLYTEYQQIG